jgi:hypothetical protein
MGSYHGEGQDDIQLFSKEDGLTELKKDRTTED